MVAKGYQGWAASSIGEMSEIPRYGYNRLHHPTTSHLLVVFEVRRAWPKNLPLLLRQSLRRIQLLSKAGKLRLNLVHMRSISSFTWQYTRDVQWEHWTWGMRRVDLASLEDMMPDASPATCWFHHFHHCLLWPGTRTLQEPTTLGAKICVTATMDVSKSGCTGCIRGNMFPNLQTTCRPARHFYTCFPSFFHLLFCTSWCTASCFMASALFWSTTANLCNSCDHHSPGAPRTGQTFPLIGMAHSLCWLQWGWLGSTTSSLPIWKTKLEPQLL